MPEKESHAIRNGIIATVIGGILLSFWPPFLSLLKKILDILLNSIKTIFHYMVSEHFLYGWLIVLMSLMSLTLIIIALPKIRKSEPGVEDLYTEDHLFGVTWQWTYILHDIKNLWCLCPTCNSELVYSQFIPDRFYYTHDRLEPYTEFICERCDHPKVKLKGNKSYALESVEREIRRKIRTGEWNDILFL